MENFSRACYRTRGVFGVWNNSPRVRTVGRQWRNCQEECSLDTEDDFWDTIWCWGSGDGETRSKIGCQITCGARRDQTVGVRRASLLNGGRHSRRIGIGCNGSLYSTSITWKCWDQGQSCQEYHGSQVFKLIPPKTVGLLQHDIM